MPIETLESRRLLSASSVTAAAVPVEGTAQPFVHVHAAYAPSGQAGDTTQAAPAAQAGYPPSRFVPAAAANNQPGDYRAMGFGRSGFHGVAAQGQDTFSSPLVFFDPVTGMLSVVYIVPVSGDAPAQPAPTPNPARPTNAPASIDQSAPATTRATNAVPVLPDVMAAPQFVTREAKVAANAVLDGVSARPNTSSASTGATTATPTVGGTPARAGGTFSARLITSIEFAANVASSVASNAVAGVATAVVNESRDVAAAVATPMIAAAVEAAPRLFHFAQINWANAFTDPWADVADEGASLPLATVGNNTRAWAITGAVAAFDLVLASWYLSRSARRKKAAKSQDIRVGLA